MNSVGLRELKKSRLRQAVQREAFRLFAEQGYQRTTVEQIAEAAEIPTTTFYRYYSSKDDVVLTGVYDPAAHPEPPKPPTAESLCGVTPMAIYRNIRTDPATRPAAVAAPNGEAQ